MAPRCQFLDSQSSSLEMAGVGLNGRTDCGQAISDVTTAHQHAQKAAFISATTHRE